MPSSLPLRPSFRQLLRLSLTLPLLVAAVALAPSARAEPVLKSAERTRQKQQAEQERAELRKKLEALKSDIAKTEKAHGHAADALAESEKAISGANRSLRELAAEQQRTRQHLELLSKSQQELEAAVAQQRARLEKMLREQYMAGHDDRVRLLLSGDNPNRIARELRYLGYVSAEQVKAIAELQQNLDAIEANKADAEETRAALDDIAAEQREQKALLEKEKGKRKALVTQLSSRLGEQRRQAGSLARDEERLSSLVDRLAVLIAQQRKADEEEAKRRARMKAEAKEREAKEAKDKLVAKSRTEDKAKADARDGIADNAKPAPLAKAPAPKETKDKERKGTDELAELPPPPDGTAFAGQRGKLKLPVKGELAATFGARRADGPAWKGIFIKAAEGSEVRAAGAGEVVFADWMRGFGNLLIVDHGGQYMSIYGNNQAVLKRPGDRVKAGDVVATVGNSGGNEQSGLYFEMRHQGRAFDPLTWINR
jgi:septal ring factor EnvC (AmiA/AmiB activator)